VHTNGYFSISGNPRFGDKVTSANQTDSYYNDRTRTYRQGATSTDDPSWFYHYYSNYSNDRPLAYEDSSNFSFHGGQPQIPLPKDTGQILDNADYVFNGNVTIKFNAGGTADVTYSGGSTTIDTTLATIYTKGQAEVSGTVSGRVTLGAKGSIHITDDLVYNDDTKDVMGMVAEGQIVVDSDPNVREDRYIDAAIMTLNDSFTVARYNQGTNRGTLHLFGAMIQKNRGPVGTFDGRSGTIMTGYAKDYRYDTKLLNFPPPNFPTTGTLKLKAFLDTGALND